MTELTLAELEELGRLVTWAVGAVPGEALAAAKRRESQANEKLWAKRHALLAMARELIRIRSALEFLGHRGHHVICSHQAIPTGLLPRDVIARATERGWQDPTDPTSTKAEAENG